MDPPDEVTIILIILFKTYADKIFCGVHSQNFCVPGVLPHSYAALWTIWSACACSSSAFEMQKLVLTQMPLLMAITIKGNYFDLGITFVISQP